MKLDDSQPSPLWERFAVTSKVKSQLRRFFRSTKRDEHIRFGKEILVSIFLKENIDFNETTKNKLTKVYKLKNIENIYELIGSGSITAISVLKKLYPEASDSTKVCSRYKVLGSCSTGPSSGNLVNGLPLG